MKKIKLFALALIGLLSFNSCGDFGDDNIDPNNPSQADTRYLFTYACKRVYTFSYVANYNPWTQLFPQYLSERQNIQYSDFGITDFNTGPYYYDNIRNLETIIKMNTDEATKNASNVIYLGSTNNQLASSRTLRAFYYMHLTDIMGMLPYTEALKGDEANFTPKYDTQEFIYQDLDKELTEAYSQFEESGSLNETNDILYQGNVSNWKKLNASLRMMMAIKLSDVAPETGKARFAKAYADGGMTQNSELLEYKFLEETDNENPLYTNIVSGGRKDFAPSKTILDQLIEYKDPRLAEYAEPNSRGEYKGVPFGITQSEIAKYEDMAFFNKRYYKQDAPIVVISPSHILLIEAEAAVRGWINENPEDLYKAGIKASFDQYGISSAEFDKYMAQDVIKLTGSPTEKIEKIAMQRWLANFMQNGVEAWSDWRRLNVPNIKPGPSATISHIPYRRVYYPNDYNTNKANYDTAIATQGADNLDTRVWWDVADNN
ncbi:MAG: hypothetical protein PARBA_01770 [Parabacteroides sp.]